MRKTIGEILGTIASLALPFFDFVLVVYLVYIATVPDLLLPFVAMPVGCIVGVIALAMFILPQGNTVIEINIGAFILFVLILIAYPTARQIPERRRANLQRRALKAQREHALQHQQSASSSAHKAQPSR